jgi:glycosyltransferase involved in cell wall biosynthesis
VIKRRLAVLCTHPIQYYSPWFAHMADQIDVHVYYAHRQTAQGQAAAGFSTAFDWDLPLLEGYTSTFLNNVAKAPSIQQFFGCNTPEIGQLLHQGGYDALLMFGWNKLSFLQAWRGARAAGIPVMIRLDSQLGSMRSALKLAFKRPLYSFVLPRAAHYLSPGERSDSYLRHYNVPDRRIHRVPHMVDVERFAQGTKEAIASGAAAALRKEYGARPDETIFLTVGKLIHKKRPTLVLEALNRMGRNQGATLWIIGDGPLEKEIDEKIINQKLNVKRLGFINQTELPRYYAAADCLILPSDGNETWGLVVNEAQACGLPAIVSNEAGCAPELIKEGVTGWILHQPNPTALAELLTHVKSHLSSIDREAISEYAKSSSYHVGTEKLISAISQIKKEQCH